MTVTVDQIWPLVVGLGGLGVVVFLVVRASKRSARRAAGMRGEMNARIEALFRASFPELQPHFHPARVHEYVSARRARKVEPRRPFAWKSPPGFPAAAVADIEVEGERERVRLADAAGATLAQFTFDDHAEGGVIRLGKGKFTVSIVGPEPRVRYWHPEREFKWTPTRWKMNTGMAEQPLESTSSSSHDSDSHSSSRSSSATAAAAGAGIVAAGGTFDGGGASAAWDDSGGGSSSSGSDSSPDFSSVESGSSSSSSTSY